MNSELLVDYLQKKNKTISFAESCTGGMVAARLVDVANVSKIFNMSFVTYSNEAKVQLLGVNPLTINQYGVVSEEVAAQMASGVCKVSGSDIGVGVSGIAGPTGGSKEKPIGTVCFGFCIDNEIKTFTKHFGALGRNKVREESTNFVYNYLIEIFGKNQ